MKKTTSYGGNIKLKRRGIVEHYTEEQVKEIIKCKNDPIYFIKKYIKIINLDDGLVNFKLYDFQEEIINIIHKNLRIIGKLPRQSGKTTTVAAYFCHYMIFNENKRAAILANKESTAKEILYRIKIMFENLPMWLKIGVLEWNKGSVEFENGSKLIAASTSSSAIRGLSINLLLLDEFAFISPGVYEDFIQSVYPTISSSKKSKIIMISTPCGLNHFYKFWKEAEKGINGYKYIEIEWDDIPGRSEAWKTQMISEIGKERFAQEFNADFLGSSNTLIATRTIRNMMYEDPIKIQYDGKFKIYKNPVKDRQYVCFCDVSEGVGGDFSTIQTIDVTELPWEQVAVYKDNTIKTNLFSNVINNIGNAYNIALVIVENNSIGLEVLNNLNYNDEYENLFYYDKKFGLRMTKGSKQNGCSHLKTFVEADKISIVDIETIEQFSYFEKQNNGSYSAAKNKHDDLITPFILFSFFMSKENFTDMWLDQDDIVHRVYGNVIEDIEENLLPVGFFPDSLLNEDYEE